MIVKCFIFGILLQAVGITLTVVAFVHMEPLFFLGLVPMYIGTALIGIAAIKVEEYVMNLNERVKGGENDTTFIYDYLFRDIR